MTFDPNQVQTVSFDSFSTLVDPHSASSTLQEYVDNPDFIAGQWHSLAVHYATVVNYLDTYRTYYDLHRDALRYLLETCDVTVSETELEEMTEVYHELEPFEDVRNGIKQLNNAGYNLAIISNANLEMLESLLAITGIGNMIDQIVSADEIEVFKPAIEIYEHAANRTNTSIEAIAHVGAGWGDIMGCMHAGMQGIFIDRKSQSWPSFYKKPDLVIGSIPELCDLLSD